MTDRLFFSSQSNTFFLYILCGIEKLLPFQRLEKLYDILFFYIKKELFYISGSCQNSGVCCRGLGIKYKKNFITTMSSYLALCKKKIEFKRFIPHFKPSRSSTVLVI